MDISENDDDVLRTSTPKEFPQGSRSAQLEDETNPTCAKEKNKTFRKSQNPNEGRASTSRNELVSEMEINSDFVDNMDDTGMEVNVPEELDNLPPIQPIHLSFSRKVAVASGHVLNDLCASLWFSYLLLYFQKVIEFDSQSSSNDSRYAAGLMFLGQLIDGLATPIVGYEADQDFNCFLFRRKYGRCKSWHLVGVILVMVSFPFVFSPCIGCTSESSDWAKIIYYSPFIVVFQIGWASTQISHLALIPKMHPDQLIRTELLAMRYAFTVAANVIIFLMTWLTLGNNNDCKITPDDAQSFMKIAMAAVGIGGIFALLFHIFVKEEPDDKVKKTVAILNLQQRRLSQTEGEFITSYNSVTYKPRKPRRKSTGDTGNTFPENISSDEESARPLLLPSDSEDETSQRPSLRARPQAVDGEVESMFSKLSTKHISLGKDRMSMKDWLTLPQFYLVALIYLATRMSMNLSQVYVPLYLQDSLRLPCRTIATVPLCMYLSGFTISLFVKVLNKHLGRQLAYVFGAILLIFGSFLIFLLNWDGPDQKFLKEYAVYFVASLLGGGASAILITSLSIIADLIEKNIENGAFVYGAMSFCDKLSTGIAVLLISHLVPCSDEENNPVGEGDHCDKSDNIPFYRDLLSFSAGGCAMLGVFGVLLLTVRIHIQNKRRNQ